MIKEDCFAYERDKHECKCLNELYCENENCKFYKRKEEIKRKYIVR